MPGETCLFKSCDVRQWLDYRHYHNRPALRSYFDYVVAPVELLNEEFDSFKVKLPNGGSCFPPSKIISFWAKAEQRPLKKAEMNGREYMVVESGIIDDLAMWMKKARAANVLHGTAIFR